jgi:cytochrome c oxidase assembly protein subunit 15
MSIRGPAYHAGVRDRALLLRRLALASIVVNITIVVTGGAVRLTGSGLGCPTWPRCEGNSFVPTGELGLHSQIEFTNRMITYLVGAVALATLLVARKVQPERPAVRRLAWALFLGIPAQAVLGGITVLTDLNPWIVMGHLMLTMALVAGSTVLYRRLTEGDEPAVPIVVRRARYLALAIAGVTAVVLYLGTIVTGSGPHAGDAKSPRTGLNTHTVSEWHAAAVLLLIALTLAAVMALAVSDAPSTARRAALILVGVQLGQGLIGWIQYATDLPAALVAAHMLGAGLLVVATTRLVLATRERCAASDTTPNPSRSQASRVPAMSRPISARATRMR